MDAEIYRCKKCGNMMGVMENHGCTPSCCGEPMALLEPNTTDAATEKHVPVAEVDGATVKVKVGSAPHPMTEEHYIEWIMINTEKGRQRKRLSPSDAPEAAFKLTDDDKFLSAVIYCNLHGLWKG